MQKASKCTHCNGNVTPIIDIKSGKSVTGILICESCFTTKQYHSHPYIYEELFRDKGYKFTKIHPKHPKAFQDTHLDKLPIDYSRTIQWWREDGLPPTMKSILLHGTTGTGKSRTAWELFSTYWSDRFPARCEFYSMRRLERDIEESFGEYGSEKGHGQMLDRICNLDLLVLDDLGKEQMTARMESDLFAIIDSRTQDQKLTIITTNYVGSGIVDRFRNKETGEPFVRRLREYFISLST
jgi:hypothetical protein